MTILPINTPSNALSLRLRSALYQCAICDGDFSQRRRTRQWQRVRSDTAPEREERADSSWVKGRERGRHLLGLIRPQDTKAAFKVVVVVVKAVFSLSGTLEIGKEVARALKARIAAFELEHEDLLSYARKAVEGA